MVQEECNGLFWGCTQEGGCYVVTPELQAESTNLRRGDCVGDSGEFEIEGADCYVGALGGDGDEGEDGIRWSVIFSKNRRD